MIDRQIEISDHAIVRYFERIGGLDIESVKQEILSDAECLLISSMGDGKYPIGDRFQVIVKNSTVVSIVKDVRSGTGLCNNKQKQRQHHKGD